MKQKFLLDKGVIWILIASDTGPLLFIPLNECNEKQTGIVSDFCLGFFKHSEQSVFRTAPALKCVLNNKVSTSLTLSRTEGIAVERIQHLNTEFCTEVKKERYRLNLSLSSRLRASNQNLYEVFQIRPIE